MTVVIATVVTVTVVIFVTVVILVTVVIVTVVIVTVATVVIVTYFSKNNLTPRQQMRYSQGSFLRFSRCFLVDYRMLRRTESVSTDSAVVGQAVHVVD